MSYVYNKTKSDVPTLERRCFLSELSECILHVNKVGPCLFFWDSRLSSYYLDSLHRVIKPNHFFIVILIDDLMVTDCSWLKTPKSVGIWPMFKRKKYRNVGLLKSISKYRGLYESIFLSGHYFFHELLHQCSVTHGSSDLMNFPPSFGIGFALQSSRGSNWKLSDHTFSFY